MAECDPGGIGAGSIFGDPLVDGFEVAPGIELHLHWEANVQKNNFCNCEGTKKPPLMGGGFGGKTYFWKWKPSL